MVHAIFRRYAGQVLLPFSVDKVGIEPTFHDIVERVPESLLIHINQVDWLGLRLTAIGSYGGT